MVNINYRNNEIEALFNRGKSMTFKVVMNKKLFMKAICSFKSVLNIINNVVELKYYQFLHYQRNTAFSTVTVECAGLLGNVVFTEEDQGCGITINELIINNDYGKTRSI